MNNPEDIVSPGVAAELKRLGFRVPCLRRYKNPREGAKHGKGRNGEVRNWNNGNHTSAPTNAVALAWLDSRVQALIEKYRELYKLELKIREGYIKGRKMRTAVNGGGGTCNDVEAKR